MANFSQHQSSVLQSHRPKFCTLILHPEHNYLKIEDEFATRHGRDLPRTVFLKVHASDKLWRIKVFKEENGEVLFKNGWEEFIQYYSVKLGGFLVFTFDTSSSIFDVFIYDKTSVHIDGDIDEETRSESNGGFGQVSESRKRFHFSKTMKQYHQYRVDIPGSFARNAGICVKDIIILKVKDTEGKEWPVSVTKRAAIYSLCAGWIEFVTDNKVTIGSRISFMWLAKSTILVKILEAGTKQLLISSTSRRGKQLKLLELSGSDVENEDDITLC